MVRLENLPEKEFNEKRDSVRKFMVAWSGIFASCLTDYPDLLGTPLYFFSLVYSVKHFNNTASYLHWYYFDRKKIRPLN